MSLQSNHCFPSWFGIFGHLAHSEAEGCGTLVLSLPKTPVAVPTAAAPAKP